MTGPEHVVVAGAGLAGLRTVEELRARGYAGQITLIGAEARPPYDRPPLSKKLMTGEIDDTSLRPDLAALDVNLRLGETATGLAPGELRTDAGRHGFDALVLATGATPVRLPGPGPQRVLRTLDDALELRARLRPGVTLAIIGAGWIGAELATAATARGARVTVVEAGPAPLAGALGAEVGGLTAPWYAAAGVDLRTGLAVASVEAGGLALAGGGFLAADLMVTAVGVRPAVAWLDGSGIELAAGTGGVAVDAGLRTSMPGVFAAGDCAAFWSGRYGARLRFEHWDIALHAPEVAAASILGGTESYDPVPYFWSEQFGRMVQYVGYHRAGDRLIWRGDPRADHGQPPALPGSASPAARPAPGGLSGSAGDGGVSSHAGRSGATWAVAWLAGDRLVALLSVNAPRDILQARRVIAAGVPVDAARLADPAVPVRDCVLGARRA